MRTVTDPQSKGGALRLPAELLDRMGSNRLRVHYGTTDSPAIALLRQLLNPAVVALTLLACLVVYGERFQAEYWALAALAFIVSTQVFSEPLLYQDGTGHWFKGWFRHGVFQEWLLVSASLLLLAFALKTTEFFSRKVILTWFMVTPFIILGAQALVRRITRTVVTGDHVRGDVIIGANRLGCELARRLQANPHLGSVKGFFDDREETRMPAVPGQRLLGKIAEAADYVRRHNISRIFLCMPMRSDPRTLRLIEELRDTTASVYFVPDIFLFDSIQARFVEIDGMPLLATCESPFCGMNGVLKRASDIVLATGLLAVLWPLMLAIAIAVWRSSPGPILFKQRRYGLYGEEILVYKFRSMTVCEDGADIVQARRDDVRITPFGRLLRRTSLDELPQLLNVLHGTMSLVGPRPHAISHSEMYRKQVKGFMLRHKVRPGITGWAQVNGLRGETETLDKMQERVAFDLDYLRNWSIGLDLFILLKTVKLVWRDRNAY